MTRKLEVAERARRDLELVLRRTLIDFGQRQFEVYDELIRSALQDIATDPSDFRSQARSDLGPNSRSMHIGRRGRRARHLFVYRIMSDDTVRSDRLLHDAMDIYRHASDGPESPADIPEP